MYRQDGGYRPDGSYRQDGTYAHGSQQAPYAQQPVAAVPAMQADKQQASSSYAPAPSVYPSWSAVHESSVRSSRHTPETSGGAVADTNRISGSAWPDTSTYGYYARSSGQEQSAGSSSSVHSLMEPQQQSRPAYSHSTLTNRPVIDETMRDRLRQAYEYRAAAGYSRQQNYQPEQRSDTSYSNGTANGTEATVPQSASQSSYETATGRAYYAAQNHASQAPTYPEQTQQSSSYYNNGSAAYAHPPYNTTASTTASTQIDHPNFFSSSYTARLAAEIRRDAAKRAVSNRAVSFAEPVQPASKSSKKKASRPPSTAKASRKANNLSQPSSTTPTHTPPNGRAQLAPPTDTQQQYARQTSHDNTANARAGQSQSQTHGAAQDWQSYQAAEQPEERGPISAPSPFDPIAFERLIGLRQSPQVATAELPASATSSRQRQAASARTHSERVVHDHSASARAYREAPAPDPSPPPQQTATYRDPASLSRALIAEQVFRSGASRVSSASTAEPPTLNASDWAVLQPSAQRRALMAGPSRLPTITQEAAQSMPLPVPQYSAPPVREATPEPPPPPAPAPEPAAAVDEAGGKRKKLKKGSKAKPNFGSLTAHLATYARRDMELSREYGFEAPPMEVPEELANYRRPPPVEPVVESSAFADDGPDFDDDAGFEPDFELAPVASIGEVRHDQNVDWEAALDDIDVLEDDEDDEYERQRDKRIQANQRMLAALGLVPSAQDKSQRGKGRKKGPRFDADGTTRDAPPPGESYFMAYVEAPALSKSQRILESFKYFKLPPVPEHPEVPRPKTAFELDEQRARFKYGHYSEIPGESCHQCRRKSDKPKMKCHSKDPDCGLEYCKSCVDNRYDFPFDADSRVFICPKCLGNCNCTLCLKYSPGFEQLRLTLKNTFGRSRFNLQEAAKNAPNVQTFLESIGFAKAAPRGSDEIHAIRFVRKATDTITPPIPDSTYKALLAERRKALAKPRVRSQAMEEKIQARRRAKEREKARRREERERKRAEAALAKAIATQDAASKRKRGREERPGESDDEDANRPGPKRLRIVGEGIVHRTPEEVDELEESELSSEDEEEEEEQLGRHYYHSFLARLGADGELAANGDGTLPNGAFTVDPHNAF